MQAQGIIMEKIVGFKLPIFPFTGKPKKIRDLIYYDGPLMTYFHYGEGTQRISLIFYWVDCDEKYNRWLVLLPVHKVLEEFLERKTSFFNLLAYSVLFMVDIDNDLKFHNVTYLVKDNLPKCYLPYNDWTLNYDNIDLDEEKV